MEFEHMNEFSNENFDDSSEFKDMLEQYIGHYKWFILSVVLFGLVAFFYIRVQIPKYNISATILIKDKEKGASYADLSAFESLGLFGSGENSIENEIQILQSRRLMAKVVEELQLNIRYFIEDSPYDKEQYPNFPVILKFKSDEMDMNEIGTNFEILIKSGDKFEFIGFDDKSLGTKSFGEYFYADLGNEDFTNRQRISIERNENFKDDLIGEKILVKITPLNYVVTNYLERIIIEPVNDKISNVLTISVNENIKNKGLSFVNNLIEQYNADRINDENEVSQSTTKFLDDRIALIATELSVIESSAEVFKTKNRMINEEEGSNYYLQSSTQNENQAIEANTQMQLVNYMLEELNKSGFDELLPVNIGLSDLGVVRLTNEYNTIILKRNRILKSSKEKNPIVVNIDSQLVVLKDNLRSSLNTTKSSLQIQINSLSKHSGRINSRIASVPKNEREYKNIVRKEETKNALYLFLLQKREESILSNAIGIEKSKVINSAYSTELPISPKKKLIYFAALLLGILVPASVIYMKDVLDTKVHDEKDIRKLKIPYIGDIPLAKSKNDIFVKDGDNSSIAEAFRYIRTNINFMLDSKEKGKTIFVTSTQSGEGKTFASINLANSLAISGKKTLLIGMDLRASKITKILDLEEILGVANFIKNESLALDGITETFTKLEKLHVINSGNTPPNPVELLMSKRVKQLFDEVKEKYEYIVVDTAPVGMVTDTIQIGKFADLTIYVIKANHMDKRMLHIPEKLNHDNKLTNMAVLINGTDHSRGSYGYGYSYGGDKKKKTYW